MTAKNTIQKFNAIAQKNEGEAKLSHHEQPFHIASRRSSMNDAISKFQHVSEESEERVRMHSYTPRINDTRRSSMRGAIAKFQAIADDTEGKLKINPYSENYEQPKYSKGAADYARPPPGSKTEKRGIRAGDYVTREVLFLLEVINENATGEHPNRSVKFGPLFYTYQRYSDKLVGMLLRARKYGLVAFEGEMLYQKQDDHKDILMLKTLDEIKRTMRYSGDPVNCITFVQ